MAWLVALWVMLHTGGTALLAPGSPGRLATFYVGDCFHAIMYAHPANAFFCDAPRHF